MPLPYLKAQVGTDGLVVRDEQVRTGVGQLLDWACTPSEENPVRPGRRAPLFLLHTHTARESLGTTSSTPAAVRPFTNAMQTQTIAFSPPKAGSQGKNFAALCSPWSLLPLCFGEFTLCAAALALSPSSQP